MEMMCVRIVKNDKSIRLYNRKEFVVILCTFIPTKLWWEELQQAFGNVQGHGWKEVDLALLILPNQKISEVYEIVKNQNWWQDGETVDENGSELTHQNG